MTEIVDRCAKALCRYRAKNPADEMGGAIRYEDGPLLDEYVEQYWEWYIGDARAVIDAMKEPIADMIDTALRIE